MAVEGPSDPLFLGRSYQFSMAARLSDGSILTSGGTWGSDAPSVATVHGAGLVEIVGVGEATIFVDYQGQRATRRVRSTPHYEGILDTTTAQLVRCTFSGHQNFRCSTLDGDPDFYRFVYGSFKQDGFNVTASMERRSEGSHGIRYQSAFLPVTAAVAANGELRFASSIEWQGEQDGKSVTNRLEGRWVLSPRDGLALGGTHVLRETVSGGCCSGYQEFEVRLRPVSLARIDAAAVRTVRVFALLVHPGSR